MTYTLGKYGFNKQLDEKTKRFTYFVPSDYAWKTSEPEFPSAFKKLFMQEFNYHVSNCLNKLKINLIFFKNFFYKI